MQRMASTAKCHHRVVTVVTDGGRQVTGQTDVTVMEAGPGRMGRLTTSGRAPKWSADWPLRAPLAHAGRSGDGEGAVPGERVDVVAPVVVEPVAGVGDDFQVAGASA